MTGVDDPDLGGRLADIVEEAARLILPLWKSGLEVTAKSDESPVTEADRRGEKLILQRLASAFPDMPVLSEEHCGVHGAPDKIGALFFAVDPLDGTKAFVRGDPSFTVNIGLIDAGKPIAGAVCAPATGETWFTSPSGALKRTGGAARWVCARPWNRAKSVALVSHTMKPEAQAALKAEFGVALTLAMDSSIKLCRIAEGEADLYLRRGPTMEWDIAAGHAVLTAAGGRLTTPEGEPFVYGKAAEGFRNGPFIARGAA